MNTRTRPLSHGLESRKRTIVDVKGFRARGAHIGIKSKRRDLALIVSDRPAAVGAVFTRNQVVAAPVVVSRRHVADGHARAIVCTAGNANACTGKAGLEAAERVAAVTAAGLGIETEEVIVASTGIIGKPFPVEKVVSGIEKNLPQLNRRSITGSMVANAITTTDTFAKESFRQLRIDGTEVSIGGIAKGSGMIHPDMATMLGFLCSDVAIVPELAQRALREAVEETFNMITVDGDTSTNDMVVLLANGAAGNPVIEAEGPSYRRFATAIHAVCRELARAIVSDGEGATKMIEYVVRGAADVASARQVARTVSNSNLVKTAMFGRDPNWGRVMAAVGRSGVAIDPDRVDVAIGSHRKLAIVTLNGALTDFDASRLKQMLRSSRLRVVIDLHLGEHEATAWGTDFSYEYVRINAEYST